MREMLDEEGRNGKAKTEMQQGRTGHGQGQEQRPQGLAALNFKTDLAFIRHAIHGHAATRARARRELQVIMQ